MIHGDALRALAAAGATTEMIIALVEADAAATEARDEVRKQDARARNRRNEMHPQLWYALRREVFERDGFACTYCGSDGGLFPLECDHIIPLCQGGGWEIENLTTACKPCNSSKRHRTPEEWRA